MTSATSQAHVAYFPCNTKSSVFYGLQPSTVYPAGHAHISQVHVRSCLLLFTGDTGVGIGLVGDV